MKIIIILLSASVILYSLFHNKRITEKIKESEKAYSFILHLENEITRYSTPMNVIISSFPDSEIRNMTPDGVFDYLSDVFGDEISDEFYRITVSSYGEASDRVKKLSCKAYEKLEKEKSNAEGKRTREVILPIFISVLLPVLAL